MCLFSSNLSGNSRTTLPQRCITKSLSITTTLCMQTTRVRAGPGPIGPRPVLLLFRCTIGGVLTLSARCWSDLGLSNPPESVHQLALQLKNANVDVSHIQAPSTRSPSAINSLVCEPNLTDADRQRVTAYSKPYGVDGCGNDDASLHRLDCCGGCFMSRRGTSHSVVMQLGLTAHGQSGRGTTGRRPS